MTKQKKILGVIPARWGATRFPGKILAAIAGKPMIHHVITRARQAQLLSEVVVATDDERIAAAAAQLGCRSIMTAPELPSGTDRIAAAVRHEASEIIVNIQGDEPLLDVATLDGVVAAMLAEKDLEMATAAIPLDVDKEARDVMSATAVKVVCDERMYALYFSRSPIPFIRDRERLAGIATDQIYRKHLGVYAYRKEFLLRLAATAPCLLERAEQLEQLRALHMGARIKVVMSNALMLSVDVPSDVERVEAFIRAAAS